MSHELLNDDDADALRRCVGIAEMEGAIEEDEQNHLRDRIEQLRAKHATKEPSPPTAPSERAAPPNALLAIADALEAVVAIQYGSCEGVVYSHAITVDRAKEKIEALRTLAQSVPPRSGRQDTHLNGEVK